MIHVVNDYKFYATEITEAGNTIENMLKFTEISVYNWLMSDLYVTMRANPTVDYRYLFIPDEPLASLENLLEFNKKILLPMVELGEADAKKMIGLGEGWAFNLVRDWNEKPAIKKEFKVFHAYLRDTISK